MHTNSQLAARQPEILVSSINCIGFEPQSWRAPYLTASPGSVPSLLLSFLWRFRFHSDNRTRVQPNAASELNQDIHVNDEPKITYVNLQNTASAQTLGRDLSYEKQSQPTCTAVLFMHQPYLPEKAV